MQEKSLKKKIKNEISAYTKNMEEKLSIKNLKQNILPTNRPADNKWLFSPFRGEFPKYVIDREKSKK